MALAGKLMNKQSYSAYYRRLQLLAQQPTAKVSGLISLTIFVVAFFGIFAILPTFKTIAALSKEIDDAKTVNIKLEKKILALNKAEELYEETIDEFELVNKVLPQEPEFERLAWQIQWLANDNQVQVTGGSFGEFPVKDGVSKSKEAEKILVDVSLSGQYLNIKSLMEKLAGIDRLITIEEVAISNKSLRRESDVITATIEGTAYYLPNQVKETSKTKEEL